MAFLKGGTSMPVITFDIPDYLLSDLQVSQEQIVSMARAALAAELFQTAKLSLAGSAALAGMSLSAFAAYLSQREISVFSLSEEELIEDLNSVRKGSR